MCKWSKRLVVACVCVLLVLAICSIYSIIPQHAYAQIGAEVKDKIQNSLYNEPMTDVEKETYEEKLNTMDFKFQIPSDFQDGVNGTQLNLSKVYVSPINQYETKSEWFAVSVQERVQLSQIPDDLLKEMSTDELIVSCLNYNLLVDLGLYNSLQEGFAVLAKQYNGLQELLKRPDAGSRLLTLYKAIDLNKFSEEDRYCTLRMTLIHTLLAEQSVLQTLNDKEVEELVKACYLNGTQVLATKSSCFNFTPAAYVGLRCLYEHDSSVRKIIDNCGTLKAFVVENAPLISIEQIDDQSLGKIAVLIDEYYLE